MLGAAKETLRWQRYSESELHRTMTTAGDGSHCCCCRAGLRGKAVQESNPEYHVRSKRWHHRSAQPKHQDGIVFGAAAMLEAPVAAINAAAEGPLAAVVHQVIL